MRLLFTFLAGLATAASQCSSSWYYQAGKQYNYEVVTENSVLFTDKGFEGDSRAADERVEGVLSLNVVADCVAEVTYLFSRRRESSSARVFYGAGSINSVSFPEGQSVESNNVLKAILSALQLDEQGVKHHPATVAEITHNGFSESKYTCDCGCKTCDCETCDGIVVTRIPTMTIDTTHSGRSPVLQTLTGKLAIDNTLDISMEPIVCEYAIRRPIPESVRCSQTVRGSEIDTLISSITITYESEEGSSESVLASAAMTPAEDLKIKHTEHFNDVCQGDMGCLLNMFTSVVNNDNNAVKNQFLLRKAIRALSTEQLGALITSVAVDPIAITHIFTELTKCGTEACILSASAMLESVELPVYPAVFRAVQYSTPTEHMINLMANDISISSSVEKLNIFLGAIKEIELSNYDVVLSMIKTLIGDSCQAVQESFTLTGYFASQTETTETEMVVALKIAQALAPEIIRPVLEDVTKCLTYSGAATIVENAIIAIGPFYTAEQIITNVPAATPATVAAIIVSIRESNPSVTTADIYQLFEARYGEAMATEKAFINQMILAIDNTEAAEGNYRWGKSVRVPLPASLEEVELFSGLTLSTNIITSGASITVKNELLNGEGLRLVEGDIIINSMYDMLKYALSGYYRCPESLWTAVLATEYSMVTLVESIVNMNFENILTNNALSNIRGFIQMGGVQFKLLGEEVNADWIISLFENVQRFLSSENTSYKPTLAEIYFIFTNGLEHNYFNIFDSRETMSVGLVSGLKITSTVASITAVGYNGIILPHLLSLGNSGDIKMSPSLSHGIVSETKLSSISLDKTATTIFSSHVSFSGELAYDKSATGLELSLRLAPSSSPMTFHQWQYIDNDFSQDVKMQFSSIPVLASNVQVRSCDQGFEISLDREIGIHLLSRVVDGALTVSGSVDGLGAVSTTISGTILDGALTADVQTESGINANVQIKSTCLSIADCTLSGDISLPNMAPISSITRLEFASPNLSFRSQNMIGERVLLHMMADANPESVRIASKSDAVRAETDLLCRHNLFQKDAVKTASCDLTFNDKFGVLTLNKERSTFSWDLRTNVVTLIGSFNPRRELDIKFFTYPVGLYASAAELTPNVLANHEVIDLVMAWPVQSSGARLIALQLEVSKRTWTKFRLQQKAGSHRLSLAIPAIDLRLINNWDAESTEWIHRVQMNSYKLERFTGIPASIWVAARDARGLIVHQLSFSYPSSDSCSQQFATPEGSLVTRVSFGTSRLCFSAGAGHFAARADPAATWAPSWASFDLYTGVNLADNAAVISLINDLLTTRVSGNWLIAFTEEDKQVSVGTSIKASGDLLVEPLSVAVEVRGQVRGTDLAGILSGEYQGRPFEVKLIGEMKSVVVDGIATDAIIVYPGEGNIFNLQEIGIHLINKIPAGITLKQRDFDAKWIVDAFSKIALVDIVNRDAVIPVAKFNLRADTSALTVNIINTAPVAEIAVSIEYTSGVTATIRLPGVAIDIAKNKASVHRIDAVANNVGEISCLITPRNAPLPSISLINLGIDNTVNNLAIADGVRFTGSTKILADGSGLKADGFKIHHILHILGYDINIDTELFSKEASANTPVDAPFKWCDVEGEISYAWIQVYKQRAHLGSLGNWVKLGSQDKCSNMIGIFKEQYHQIAAMTQGGVNKARVMFPTSYTVTAPVTWDLVLADKVESFLNTPVADIYVTADGSIFTLNAISAKDVVLADSILDLSARHLKVVSDLTSLNVPVATTIETIKDKKWQKTNFDIAVADNRVSGAVDLNTINLQTSIISSGSVLGFNWDANINVVNPLVHTVAIKGAWTTSAPSVFARTQAHPFSFESDINGYSHVKVAFTGFDLNLDHETSIVLTPLSIESASAITTPWNNIICSANVIQSENVYTATINAKTGSYEGKLVAVTNSALSGLNLDYIQTGVAEIVLNLASSAASLKIDAPVVDLISQIDLSLAPISLSVTGQYGTNSINLIGSANGISLELSDILKFVSSHGAVIKADLSIANRGIYHAELSRETILPVIVTVNDAVAGTHSLVINAATIEMKNEISSIGLTSSFSASLSLPVAVALEGTFNGPFHVIVSQADLAADVLIAGNSLKISKADCDVVIEFNNALTTANVNVCTDTLTADLLIADATLGKLEAHVKGAAATLAIESESLATMVNLRVNAVPETFVLDLAANIVGHNAVVTVNVPARKIIINLPTIALSRRTIPAVVFNLAEENGIISELLQIEGLGETALTVDTTSWIISAKNTILLPIDINADLQKRVASVVVPSYITLNLSEVDGLVTLETDIKGLGKNVITVRPATWEVTAQGKIIVKYSLVVSPLDIYNQIIALVTKTQAPMLSTHFLALRADGIVTIEITPTLLSVILAEDKFLNLSSTAPLITLESTWATNNFKTVIDTSKLQLNIAASILGNTLESFVSIAPVTADIVFRVGEVAYTASYEGGHIVLNVPEVTAIDLTVVDGVVRGTISIAGIGSISINQMVVTPVKIAGINLSVVSDIDMIANVAGYELSAVAALTSSGITYQITCDVGAGLTFNLVGRTIGAIPTGNYTDLTLYEANSEMAVSLSNEYISQGVSYNSRLIAGNLESDITIDTVLLKVKLAIATEKLTLKKFVTKDLLINTQVGDVSLYTTGGISYIANKSLDIYPTAIKAGEKTILLIGGGADIPISFDLKTLSLVPNDNLIIRVHDTRIVAKLIALNNFEINVSDMVVISRNKNILHAAVTVAPISVSTDVVLAQTGFKQAFRVLNGETKLAVGTHELDISAGLVNIDWLILDSVIKANVVYAESATLNINSEILKLNSEVSASSFTLALQSEPVRAQAEINPGKLDVAVASDLAQLKILLTPDLVDNVIILRTSNDIKINGNSESINKMKLQLSSAVLKALVTVEGTDIDAKFLSGSALIVANCKELCKRSHVKIASGEKTVLETTLAIAGNTFVANLVAGETVLTINADPSTTSVATLTYKNLYNLTGKLAAGRVFEVTFESPATLVRLNNSSLVVVNQPFNIEARINETPGLVVLRVNPSENLLVNFARKPTGEISLVADIYKLVIADIKLAEGALTGDVTIIDTNIKARIAPKDARFVITGENLNVRGAVSTGKFNVTMVAPVESSVDYKNETMVVTTVTRIYTVTSENGLIKVIPKMRTVQQ